MRMNRGYTIVELIVVVAVLSILIAMSVVSMSAFQRQADESAAKSLATALRSGAEQFYARNNEYAVPNQVTGTQSDFSGPPSDAEYGYVSTNLNIPVSTLKNDRVKAVICHTACLGSNINKKYVYYLNKYGSSEMVAYTYTFGTCTYTLPAAEGGGMAYLVAYWSSDANKWEVVKSNRGMVTTSDTTNCAFKAL